MDAPNQPTTAGKSRAIYWIILVVSILAVAVGLYYFLRTSEPIENTNTTSNTNSIVNVVPNSNTPANSNSESNTNSSNNINNSANVNQAIDSSSWNTYESNKYGFRIRYPESGTISSDSIFNPIITTDVAACTFKFNGEGLGRGGSLKPISDSSTNLDGTNLVVKRYACDSGKVCLETILLANNIARIELYSPDDEMNGKCLQTFSAMLQTYEVIPTN